MRRLIDALAAQNGDAALLGLSAGAGKGAEEQDEGEGLIFHARNRRQVLAASQWQVRGCLGLALDR